MKFAEFSLDKSILKAVAEERFHTATLVQQKAIPLVLAKENVIVSAQTGTGKTAAFALPIIQLLSEKASEEKSVKKIKSVIITPTRELAIQILEKFTNYSKYTNLATTAVFGGVSLAPQKELLAEGIDILIATPGRLIDLHLQGNIDLSAIEIFVLDEADLMLDMGFINDVKKIEAWCPKKKQTLLFSATIPEKINELAKTTLKNPVKVEINPEDTTAKNIGQLLYYLPKKNKTDLCLHLLRNTINGKIIIFRRTKFGVDKLEESLLKNGYKVTSIHGDKTQSIRNKAIEDEIKKLVQAGSSTEEALKVIKDEYEMDDTSIKVLLEKPINNEDMELFYTSVENPIYEALTEVEDGRWGVMDGESLLDHSYYMGSHLKVWEWRKREEVEEEAESVMKEVGKAPAPEIPEDDLDARLE